MPTSPDVRESAEWRRLSSTVWVGRLDGAPIGMIERGRQYTATDSSERVRGRFKTLAEAQAALLPAVARAGGASPATPSRPRRRFMLVSAGTVGVLAATMAVVGLVVFI